MLNKQNILLENGFKHMGSQKKEARRNKYTKVMKPFQNEVNKPKVAVDV